MTDAAPERAEDAPSVADAGYYVADRITVEIPRDGRVVVVSDLHLSPTATTASTRASEQVAQVLGDWTEPGALVIAGDGFEMLAVEADVDGILDAHPRFCDAVASFATGKTHQVVVLPGNHDGQLAWDPYLCRRLSERLGVEHLALACDLGIDTGSGRQLVRVEHGNQLDPYNSFEDPRSPVDTPFGHHVVRQVLPQLEARQAPGSLLEGVQWLNGDPTDFVGSRLLYRKVVGRLWWLAVPFVAAVSLRFLAFLPGAGALLHHHSERWLVGAGILAVLIALVAAVVGVATMLRVNRALGDASIAGRADVMSHNAPPRARATRLVASGYAGYVSGHTHEPELSIVGDGFYANSGCGTELVRARRARLGLPQPFVAVRRISFVEMLAGAVLGVRLYLEEIPTRPPVLLERLVMAPEHQRPEQSSVVGELPGGSTWPIDEVALRQWVRRRQVRIAAGAILFGAGALNVVFALAWSISATRGLNRWLPFGIHPISGAEAIVGGLALAGVARGVRRGYQRAWFAAIVILLVSTVNRLVKGVGIEGSAIACALALFLLVERRHFRVSPPGGRRVLGWVITAGLVAVAVTSGVDALIGMHHREARDLVIALVLGTALLGLLTALPARERRRTGKARELAFERALDIFERYGGDTLDYFALRDDKSWLFTGDSLVAYTVLNRVMLVSPDPIGPPSQRSEAWSDAMDFASANGWHIAVLGSTESWLAVYRAAGLSEVYIGDEAIVDCRKFSLQGKSMKSLRGAYNRVSKAGYRVEITDPLDASPALIEELDALATETRQGDEERGFSMTLSRMFDARDRGLLLAVCYSPEGNAVAFNQYIPAAHINGYSLDVMRRTANPDALNGLTDFVIIETISWLAEHAMTGLGLNFATMRAVVAGETRKGPWTSVERSVLHHFSDTMQIESLWNFNKKYDPQWRPRYAVADNLLRLPRTGLAIARAEAVTELPFIGKLMRPRPAAEGGRELEKVP